MKPRWMWRRLAELSLVLAIAIVAILAFAQAPARRIGDEANKIGTARFFLVLFVRHDISAEAWPDSHWTRTQPMVARYILGGWLWARGHEYEHLDPNFDHTRKWASNMQTGRAPSQALLDEARIPMRALAILSAVLLYGVVRIVAGPVGGLAAALLFCGSSYLAPHMVRAMSEPPFMAFLLASLLVGLLAIKRGAARGPGIGWSILAGVLLGLAFASKLTAVIAIVAIVLWGIWAATGGAIAARLPLPRRWRGPASTPPAVVTPRPASPLAALYHTPGRRALVWALSMVTVTLLTFVATNPFLYPDPVGRTWLLFQNRQEEMAAQAAFDPSRAVTRLADRIERVWTDSLVEDTWAHSKLEWPLEAALAVLGFGWLLARALRPRPGAEAFLLLWVVGFFGGVSVGLGYVLDHYFVPTATFGLVLAGLTVGWSAQLAWSSLPSLHGRWHASPTHQEAQEAVTA